MARLAGIDGCPSGWLYVIGDTGSGELTAGISKKIDDLPVVDLALIDIPIGLPDRGTRQCDMIARALLGPGRGSSVFPSPLRPMLKTDDYRQACDIRTAIEGKKVSKQLWMLVPKIKDVDRFQHDRTSQNWLREIHPELCFMSLNGGQPILEGKRTPHGAEIRKALIAQEFGLKWIKTISSLPRSGWATDDLLDAFAALYSCRRLHAGTATSIPHVPEYDSTGLRMEMIY